MLKKLATRFVELEAQIVKLEATKVHKVDSLTDRQYVDIENDQLLNWCVKARNLLVSACRKDSEHFASFVLAEQPSSYEKNLDRLKRVTAVFFAAKEDYEGGYITSVKSLVQAEVFDDELEQAQELLKAGYAAAAAVIAGTVLETAVRNLCEQHSITQGKLDKMNADLAKAGAYNVLKQKQITAYAGTRNSAAHGKVSEFNKDDVEDLIKGAERFIADYLG